MGCADAEADTRQAPKTTALADAEGVDFGECLERMLEVYEAGRGKSDDRRGT
jgi:hypothetical protein